MAFLPPSLCESLSISFDAAVPRFRLLPIPRHAEIMRKDKLRGVENNGNISDGEMSTGIAKKDVSCEKFICSVRSRG